MLSILETRPWHRWRDAKPADSLNPYTSGQWPRPTWKVRMGKKRGREGVLDEGKGQTQHRKQRRQQKACSRYQPRWKDLWTEQIIGMRPANRTFRGRMYPECAWWHQKTQSQKSSFCGTSPQSAPPSLEYSPYTILTSQPLSRSYLCPLARPTHSGAKTSLKTVRADSQAYFQLGIMIVDTGSLHVDRLTQKYD